MIAERPLTDLAVLARWLGAFSAIVVLPGWLMIGRHARGLDPASRLYLATAGGLLATILMGLLFSALGLPFAPQTVLPAGLVLAWALGHSRGWRETAAALGDGLGALDARETLGVLTLCAGMAWIVLAGFRDYAAPNHLNDASNHAFMVSRVVATHSLAANRVFAPPFGSPAIPYLLGWHGVAALVAELGRVPAWLSAWLLPVLACAATPLALSLIWRAAGLSHGVVLLGGAFAVANFYLPVNIFSWGGFGAIAGLATAPWVLLALRALILAPAVPGALLAGLALTATLYLHTSEVFTAPLLLLVVAWPGVDRDRILRRRMWGALALAAAVFAIVGLCPLLGHLRIYRGFTASETLPSPPGLWPALRQFFTFTGGNVPALPWFVTPGLIGGLLWRRTRPLALLSGAFLLLYLGVRQFQDPLSLIVSRPYYRQFPRVIYPQMYLLPALMAAAVAGLLAGLGRLWRWPGRRILLLLLLSALVHWALYPGAYWNYRNLDFQKRGVPFSPADARLAQEMTRALPGNAVIANQYGDGSYWAMHVSGLRFLDPCSWPLGEREGLHHRPAIARLLERPWPAEVQALRDLGTAYVYVGDTVIEGVQPPLRRALLDADPRFERLLDDGDDAVYRIRWDAEPSP